MAQDSYTVTRLDGGVIRMELKPGVHVTREVAESSLAAVATAGGPGYRVLVVLSGMRDLDADARACLANAQGARAAAIVVTSPVDRIAANLFMSLSKPSGYDVKAFATEAEGVAWLKGLA